MVSGKNRPTGVTVMVVLQILTGLGSLGLGFMLASTYAFLGSLMASGAEGVTFSADFGGLLVVAGALLGGILIVIGIANLLIAYGLFKGKSWAWILCLMFAVISVVFGILTFPVGIVTILFNALIIYYLTRRNVKVYFEKVT
jgi:hypothetical protein